MRLRPVGERPVCLKIPPRIIMIISCFDVSFYEMFSMHCQLSSIALEFYVDL